MYYNSNNYKEGSKSLGVGAIVALGIVAVIVLSLIIVGGACVSTYNNLVNKEEDVKVAQADVQTMMQRRLELIPDLVETTKAAAAHEEKVYEDIANARAALNSSIESGDAQAMDAANKELTTAVNKLLVVVENYPEITASEQYTALMDQLEGSVNRISVARENYNEAVSSYNRVVRRFPGSMLANMFGFETMEEFKADDAANQTNMVDFD